MSGFSRYRPDCGCFTEERFCVHERAGMIYDANGVIVRTSVSEALAKYIGDNAVRLLSWESPFGPTLYGPDGAVLPGREVATISERDFRIPFSVGGEE